jgi:hypothetical protein
MHDLVEAQAGEFIQCVAQHVWQRRVAEHEAEVLRHEHAVGHCNEQRTLAEFGGFQFHQHAPAIQTCHGKRHLHQLHRQRGDVVEPFITRCIESFVAPQRVGTLRFLVDGTIPVVHAE